MNKVKELINKNYIIKYILILIIIVALILSSTIAYYNWESPTNTNVTFTTIADCAKIYYDAGSNITGISLFPTDNKEDGIKKEITIRTDNYNANAKFNLYLDIISLPTGLQNETLKYALYGVNSSGALYAINTSGVANSSNPVNGNFSTTSIASLGPCNIDNTKKHIVLLNNITPTITETKYVIYIWIDGTSGTNSNSMMNQEFEFRLHADGECLISPNTNAASQITSTFTSAPKLTVTTAGGESITQATSVGLMQDSFGNIRYYGSNPENYVTFNGESWRIIGVFDVEDQNGNTEKRIKIVKNQSDLSMAFDENFENDYSRSTVKTYLTGTYYNNLTTEAKNMIGQAKYYLGGVYSIGSLYADDMYNAERGISVISGSNTNWVGNIGLMYPSDYLYSTDLRICGKSIGKYNEDQTNCVATLWIFRQNYTNNWTISPNSEYSFGVFVIENFQNLNTNFNNTHDVDDTTATVSPTLYLKPEVKITTGTGASNDPYQLSL